METPFTNDPFAIIGEIFRSRHPDKPYQAYWVPEAVLPSTSILGSTTFCEDGDVVVSISMEVPSKTAINVFIHELAHVAAGEISNHGGTWQKEYLALRRAYNSTLGAPFREVTIDD